MGQALYKFIILLFAVLLQLRDPMTIHSVLPLLIAVAISLAMDVVKGNYRIIPLCIFFVTCFFVTNTICYLPLLLYDCFDKQYKWYYYLPFLLVMVLALPLQYGLWFLLILTSIAAIILKIKYVNNQSLLELYKKQRDSTKELTMLMEIRNRDLLLKQDYEVRLATLNERNRIAREIHDNVGHLLSSSLLQVGALQAINTQESVKEPLHVVQQTLNQAMDSIRSSVHDLHDDALQLDMEIRKLLSSFTFCEHTFTYDIEHPFTVEVIYHILSITKEALNNVMKHSNATHVEITIRELPRLYQIIIHDNGTKKQQVTSGIGLYNMRQRIEQQHGYIHISNDQGFRIFITLSKEETICA